MKIVAYIRVSTKKQEEKGVSLEAQKEKVRGFAKLYEHELIEVCVDAGKSASNMKRPGLQRALEILKKGEAEGLLVVKLDRLTRSLRDLGELLEKYFMKKYHLMSVSEQFNTSSANGRLMLNLLMMISQWEREIIGERTSEAMQHKRANLEYTGGRVRFGYRISEDGKHLIEDPKEQQVIQIVKNLVELGHPYRQISRLLEKRGFLSRTNKPFQAKQIIAIAA